MALSASTARRRAAAGPITTVGSSPRRSAAGARWSARRTGSARRACRAGIARCRRSSAAATRGSSGTAARGTTRRRGGGCLVRGRSIARAPRRRCRPSCGRRRHGRSSAMTLGRRSGGPRPARATRARSSACFSGDSGIGSTSLLPVRVFRSGVSTCGAARGSSSAETSSTRRRSTCRGAGGSTARVTTTAKVMVTARVTATATVPRTRGRTRGQPGAGFGSRRGGRQRDSGWSGLRRGEQRRLQRPERRESGPRWPGSERQPEHPDAAAGPGPCHRDGSAVSGRRAGQRASPRGRSRGRGVQLRDGLRGTR